MRQLTQQQFGMGPQNIALALFGGVGYSLAANQSVALSYSGLIQLGLRLPPGAQIGTVTAGQQYVITVVGEGALAGAIVTAT